MNRHLVREVENLGGSVSDPIWDWLINNGPHGGSFTWSQTKDEAPGYVGIKRLEKIVQEKIASNGNFPERAKSVVLIALKSSNEDIIIRAIQILAAIGYATDVEIISKFTTCKSQMVSKNAKACEFYLKMKANENVQTKP